MIKLNSFDSGFLIVGLTGKSRAGKDTLGNALFKNEDFQPFSFAYALKLAVHDIFGLDTDEINGDKKDVPNTFWGMTPRTILQKFGTEAMRGTFGDDIWVKLLAHQIETFWEDFEEEKDIVITDVRFDNEAEFVRDNGGIVIRIIRDEDNKLSQDEKAHASEAGVSDNLVDYTIHNNGTELDMFLKCKEILNEVRPIRINHESTSS